MKFIIDKTIFEKFPDLNIGVVIAKGINNSEGSDEIIKSIRAEESEIRKNFDSQTLSQNPKIDCWRKAYSLFGAKPKENLSSVENLYKLVLKGAEVRQINMLVDLYNLISLKHMVPLGGEDLDKVHGNIKLTIAGANEPAVLLLGDKDPRQPHEGEVIYKDDISAICRRFNWREADRTKLTRETKNVILVAEGLPPTAKEDIEKITNELKQFVQKHCGGQLRLFVLNKSNTEIEF